jgi:hypothetical protein
MSNYVFTPILGNTWIGVTENYITADVSPLVAQGLFQNLAVLRAALLPSSAYFVGWRVGLYGGKRSSRILRPYVDVFWPTGNAVNFPSNGTIPATTDNGYPPLMQISLQENVTFNNTGIARKYLGVIPSNVVGGQPSTYNQNGNVAWVKAKTAWQNFLINSSFQIAAQNTPVGGTYTITNIAPALTTGGNIGLGLSGVAAGAILTGQRLAVQHLLPTKGTRNPTMNGSWTVDSVNQTSSTSAIVYLRNSAGIDPTAQRIGSASIAFVKNRGLFSIQSLSGSQIVTHKRGKAGGNVRGRRLTRPSLDP